MKRIGFGVVVAMGLACGGGGETVVVPPPVSGMAPPVEMPPPVEAVEAVDAGEGPTLTFVALEPGATGCEWRKRTVPGDGFEVLATLDGPCEGQLWAVEMADTLALVRDNGAPWRVDLAAKTAKRLPEAPVADAQYGVTPEGAVACAILVQEPIELESGWRFSFDGVDYPVEGIADGGTSLGRVWTLRGATWEVTETGVVESGSPDAGGPDCAELASFGSHYLTQDSSPELAALDAEDLAAVQSAAGMPDTEFVGDGVYAVQSDWCEGPCTTGPVYRRTGDTWAVDANVVSFEPVDGGDLVTRPSTYTSDLVDVNGKVVWSSETNPFRWD